MQQNLGEVKVKKKKRSKSILFSIEVWIQRWLDAQLSESEAAGYHAERLKRLQVQTKERALEEALREALRVSDVSLISEVRRGGSKRIILECTVQA